VEDGRYYWVRVPLREYLGNDEWSDAVLSDWQPARYEDPRWVMLDDADIYESDPDFANVIVHPAPMEPPDA
jgi:hypothetical protein